MAIQTCRAATGYAQPLGRDSVLFTGLPRGEKTAIIGAKCLLGQYPAAVQNNRSPGSPGQAPFPGPNTEKKDGPAPNADPSILRFAFLLLLGAVALAFGLGMAIAIGLGMKDTVARVAKKKEGDLEKLV